MDSQFGDDLNFLKHIVTIDESWVNFYDLETKRSWSFKSPSSKSFDLKNPLEKFLLQQCFGFIF